jgi:hypothetical protein
LRAAATLDLLRETVEGGFHKSEGECFLVGEVV